MAFRQPVLTNCGYDLRTATEIGILEAAYIHAIQDQFGMDESDACVRIERSVIWNNTAIPSDMQKKIEEKLENLGLLELVPAKKDTYILVAWVAEP